MVWREESVHVHHRRGSALVAAPYGGEELLGAPSVTVSQSPSEGGSFMTVHSQWYDLLQTSGNTNTYYIVLETTIILFEILFLFSV